MADYDLRMEASTPARELGEGRVSKCEECDSRLFFNWGFQVAYNPASWNTSDFEGGASKHAESILMTWVHVCAHCKTPYVVDESKLINISSLIDSEEIMAGLEVLRGSNLAAKAANIDP